MASLPLCLPTIPSATICVPLRRPAMERRPRKTKVIASPLSSTTTHSIVGTSDSGCTRIVLTRPATRARVRHCSEAIGCVPGTADACRPWLCFFFAGGLRRRPPVRVRDQHGLELEVRLLQARRHVERDDRGVDVGQLAHDLDDAVSGLVVQNPAPGLPVGAPGQHHGDLGLAVGLLRGQLQCGPADAAIRAVDHVEREAGEAEALPALDEQVRAVVVDVEVHGVQVVGRQRACVLDGPRRGQVDPVHQHHHDVPAQDLGLAGLDGRPLLEHGVLGAVLAVHRDQGVDEERHHHDDHPGTLGEFGHGEDDDDDGADDGGEAVDDHPLAPVLVAVAPVVGHHAGPGHGEAGEDADGVHRDERRPPWPRWPAAGRWTRRPAAGSRWRRPAGGRAPSACGAGTSPRPRS